MIPVPLQISHAISIIHETRTLPVMNDSEHLRACSDPCTVEVECDAAFEVVTVREVAQYTEDDIEYCDDCHGDDHHPIPVLGVLHFVL